MAPSGDQIDDYWWRHLGIKHKGVPVPSGEQAQKRFALTVPTGVALVAPPEEEFNTVKVLCEEQV